MTRSAERVDQRPPESAATASDRRPLFGLWASLLVGVVLVAPFAILNFTDQEAYPAVIFPGGGQIATTLEGDVATFYTSTLLGEDSDGNRVPIDRTEFLDPIPSSHLGGLIRTGFGQDTSTHADVWIKRARVTVPIPRHVPSMEDQEEALEWVAERLTALGLRSDRLVSVSERVTLDHATGEVLDREVVGERVILG